jgi:hypothetical protein
MTPGSLPNGKVPTPAGPVPADERIESPPMQEVEGIFV